MDDIDTSRGNGYVSDGRRCTGRAYIRMHGNATLSRELHGLLDVTSVSDGVRHTCVKPEPDVDDDHGS